VLAYRFVSAGRIRSATSSKTKDKAMIKDAQSQGDLIAALHLEVLFDSGHFGNIGAYAAPSIHCPNEYDVGHLRHRKDGWHRFTWPL
jgi:hypothetical protein